MNMIEMWIFLLVHLHVSTSSQCLGSAKTPLKTFHGDTMGMLSGNRFSFKTTLEKPRQGLKNTFILVRHGMKPPCDRTYPGDMYARHFDTTWKKDTATKGANQLMNMVGRSLRTRYQSVLDSLSWDQLSVTTVNEEWAVENGEYLLQGLLHTTKHEAELHSQDNRLNKHGCAHFDSYINMGFSCPWPKSILDELDLELAIEGNVVALKYCTIKFYEVLRRFTFPAMAKTGDKLSPWWVDSPRKVFQLWQVLWFEVQECQGLYSGPKESWANILACVFEYHRLRLDYHPDIAPAFVGMMFNKIKEEKEGNGVKFHIHITDDITVTSFMWSLPENSRTLWLDYGDALILEFYEDETVAVTLFSAMMAKHETINSYNYDDLKKHFKEKGLDLTLEEFKKICSFQPGEKD